MYECHAISVAVYIVLQFVALRTLFLQSYLVVTDDVDPYFFLCMNNAFAGAVGEFKYCDELDSCGRKFDALTIVEVSC